MTHQEILATIELLPKNVQYDLATSILDRLADDGALPISGEMKAEFERREKVFDGDPGQGEPWDQVKSELFGK